MTQMAMAAPDPAETVIVTGRAWPAAVVPLADDITKTVIEMTDDVGGESAVNAVMFSALAAEEIAAAMFASSAADTLEDAFDINALTEMPRSVRDFSVIAAARRRNAPEEDGDGQRRSCKNMSSALAFFTATPAAEAALTVMDSAHELSGEVAIAPETLTALPDQDELNVTQDVEVEAVVTPTALTKTSFVLRPRSALPIASRTVSARMDQRGAGNVPRPTKDNFRSIAA